MSSAEAIQLITTKLQEILIESDEGITTSAPDKITGNGLNLYLYQITKHPSWENQNFTAQPNSISGRPPLALVLHYIITNKGSDNADGLKKLAVAMLKLHDNPVLGDIKDLRQNDPIRVTWKPLTTDEMSKIWSTFQTPYRTSVMYEVGVVLIESEIPTATPPPVISRGPADKGWTSSTTFPPFITGVRFATDNQPGAQIDEAVTFVGSNLVQEGMEVKLNLLHQHLKTTIDLTPSEVMSSSRISFKLSASTIAAGIYSAQIEWTHQNKTQLFSNTIAFSLIPKLTHRPTIRNNGDGKTGDLSIKVTPHLRDKQEISVLVNSWQARSGIISSDDHGSYTVQNLGNPSRYSGGIVRISVDGAESMAYDPNNPSNGFIDLCKIEVAS